MINKNREKLKTLAIILLCTSLIVSVVMYEIKTQTLSRAPPTFIITRSGTNYYVWYGANSTLAFQGTDAGVTINNALGNLTSGRTWKQDVMIIGNYTGIDTTINIPSFTVLDLTQAYFSLAPSTTISLFNMTSTTNVDIYGGVLNGNRYSQTPPAGGSNNQLIFEYSTEWCSIYGTTFYYSGNSAVVFLGISYNDLVQNCMINDTYNDGVNVGSGCHDIRVIDNCFYYDGHVSIVLTTCCHCTVADNTAEYFGWRVSFDGIAVFQGAFENTVTGNVMCYGNSSDGIYCDGAHNTITANVCDNESGSGFGIHLYTAVDNVVSANECMNDSIGIKAEGAAGNLITGNRIDGSSSDGIDISANNNAITENYICGCTRYGMYLLTGSVNTTIEENTITQCGSAGIMLQPGNFTFINGNNILGNGGYGINIYSSASGNNIMINNNINSNPSGAINDAGTSDVQHDNVLNGVWTS